MPTLAEIVDAVWSTEIQPGLTAREILAAWLRYEEAGEGGTTVGGHAIGPTWQDIDRIRRRDEAYDALRDWHEARRESPAARTYDEAPGDADLPTPATVGGYTPIDIDARIAAQQQRAAAPAAVTIQRTAAVEEPAGMNSLLLAAMIALLEDED